MDFRENIKNRLIEDLIGPSKGENEVLLSRPSNAYISGILYPVETKIPIEEQDEENEENTSKDLEDETSKCLSTARKFNPCTAVISFSVLSDSKNANHFHQNIFLRLRALLAINTRGTRKKR